jgi:hypothetical protein
MLQAIRLKQVGIGRTLDGSFETMVWSQYYDFGKYNHNSSIVYG